MQARFILVSMLLSDPYSDKTENILKTTHTGK